MSETLRQPETKRSRWASAMIALLPNPVTTWRLIVMSPDEIQANLQSLPELTQAEEFQENIKPEEEVDYEWVWEYAKDKFARMERIYKDLDDKANDIIKYLGGGTGLFTLGVLANANSISIRVIACAIPSFLLALISITLAARARQPNPAGELPTIQSEFVYASHYRDPKLSRANFLGQWHFACEMMLGRVDKSWAGCGDEATARGS